jgi:hypothetical protein
MAVTFIQSGIGNSDLCKRSNDREERHGIEFPLLAAFQWFSL